MVDVERREMQATAAHYTAAVYGSILVTSLVAVLDHEHATAAALVGGVAATVGVFWLAHVWAAVIGERAMAPHRFDWRVVLRAAGQEWPMVESAFPPLLALALAWAGVYSVRTGIDVALAVAIAHLFGWGVRVGWLTYGTWFGSIVSGLVDGALGVGIVVLETSIH